MHTTSTLSSNHCSKSFFQFPQMPLVYFISTEIQLLLNRLSHIKWNPPKCAKNDQSLKPLFLNLLFIPSYKLTSMHPLNKITTLDKSSVLPSPHLCSWSWMWLKNWKKKKSPIFFHLNMSLWTSQDHWYGKTTRVYSSNPQPLPLY